MSNDCTQTWTFELKTDCHSILVPAAYCDWDSNGLSQHEMF